MPPGARFLYRRAGNEHRRKRRAALVTLVARALAIGGIQEGRVARALRERVMTLTPASVILRQLHFVAGA